MDKELASTYAMWACIVLLTIYGFNKFKKLGLKHTGWLFLATLFPVWSAATIILGMQIAYFDHRNIFSSLDTYVITMFEALPTTLVFGGLTFVFTYRRFKSKEVKSNDTEIESTK